MYTKLQYKMGVDVGSTTIKIVIIDSDSQIIYKAYRRHQANIQQSFAEELDKVTNQFSDTEFCINITGSAGMGIGERIGVTFVQEVVAAVEVVNKVYPETHTLIDLGGEDAKMVFFKEGKHPDIRMNGSCAGGTGAFIDQMANLMNISTEELGNQALKFEKIYPIASRCGVFAKTDVQNLISRNIPVSDISGSILHAVALQSVTTLARGCDIKPKILCIGGPLTFIPALRNSFREVLKIENNDFILPENGEYFPAWGTALYQEKDITYHNLKDLIGKSEDNTTAQKDYLPALFKDEEEYLKWKKNRKIKPLKFQELGSKKEIECFLGIDSGSTTTKIVAMDPDANIIYRFYGSNEGNPLKKVIEGLSKFYKKAEDRGVSYKFLSSAATGYGEDLIKSALGLDYGIVETMAHLSGAQYVDPKVSFILDIGGQDIKSIFTENGVISNIELNEACSAGCGSFLQNFASTMNMTLGEFSHAACIAQYPSDLGSRCTVFMNSKVKQSLRENAGMDDIAAGLAYSVVKNCLYKVLKISNLKQLGDHIVVQGGTFRNDAVYRTLELLSGKSISSTDHPELMGAVGAALYSQRLWKKKQPTTYSTRAISLPNIEAIDTRELQCKGCTNNCSVLRFKFENGNICYAGNKCEKIFYNKSSIQKGGYNGFDEKNDILFNRGVNADNIQQGKTIGIPRVLNMFDNYPFWHTLLSECGFNVRLSPESTYPLYQKGVGSVMSDNICFPAKLVHGHILSLIEQKVDRIFYPIIPKEEKEFGGSSNSFNCPVVSGYPEVIRSSVEPDEKYGISFDKPVITFSSDKALEKGCYDYLSSLGVSKSVFSKAFEKAMKVKTEVKIKLRESQKDLLNQAIENNETAFVVAGRPYHADPLIHQKVGQILSDLGVTVFTDDVFRKEESSGFGRLNIVSQWSYPNRVVQAAMEVAKLPQNIQLIQLNSFGCGPDSFFMDETQDILKAADKNLTILRIDEIASPGSIRLRLRSLVESLKTINTQEQKVPQPAYEGYRTPYTKEDRKKTILLPWFTDFLSPFAPALGELVGYKLQNLPKSNKISADLGLMYGNNEVCYPSTLILGDIINTLQSGEYDVQDVVLAITQTGGQCRATNYLAQIKSGLQNAGFRDIPVIALSSGDSYQNEESEFNIDWKKLAKIAVDTVLYSDALQQMHSAISVREKTKGASQQVFDFYIERGIDGVRANSPKTLRRLLKEAVADFNNVPIFEKQYTRVGLIGEIFLKYNNYAQANITEWLRSKEVEVSCPPLLDFLIQFFVNNKEDVKNGLKEETIFAKAMQPLIWTWINSKIKKFEKIMTNFKFYEPSESIFAKAEAASEVLSLSNQYGEGWLIAGEIAHYARKGVNKVVCIQPFGCIANHIVAKGIEKRLKTLYPEMNILYLDIDGGIAEVNIQNRLHFMIS
ncbi:putative CoA-substrate-specific enzyme activase [Dysgonomonas alginatilytica]|uniref:Putative CoA-substrate-specific enzyme activase n=1 Tax=Dysgonomonas alginatilytica TaxID=1605892 RepID=A0A2V3PR57_9BACT|nr:acyl-CoA dehydratase activase-related protein [Dysgonomonas alginatilytica]PXV64106.1 putative CoA-substrate-specific enzyme activase [Dysgonomonas alginatilytica]